MTHEIECTIFGLGDKFIVCQHNDRQFKVMIPRGLRTTITNEVLGKKVLIRYLAKFNGRYTNPTLYEILGD